MSEQSGISQRAALIMAGVALVVGILASLAIRPPSSAPASHVTAKDGTVGPALYWRVHSAFNTRLPVLGDGMVYVVDRLREATGGRIDLELFDPGELAPAFAGSESVRSGKVDAAFTWVGYDQGRIPAATLIGAVPFGMDPPEFLAWWHHGGGRELGEALYAEHDLRPILCGLIGPETAGWFREPIRTAEDLKGLKIRFSGLAGKALERLGASVTVLPGGEIFQALEKGAIDATEFSQPVIDNMLGFDQVVKVNHFPGWHQTFSAFHLLVNPSHWQELDQETRVMIELACQAGTVWSYAVSEALQGPVIEQFPDRGVRPEMLSDELLQVLYDESQRTLDDEAAADEWFARILEHPRAFSATYAEWEERAYLPRGFPNRD